MLFILILQRFLDIGLLKVTPDDRGRQAVDREIEKSENKGKTILLFYYFAISLIN
jgi:hypothetical protein